MRAAEEELKSREDEACDVEVVAPRPSISSKLPAVSEEGPGSGGSAVSNTPASTKHGSTGGMIMAPPPFMLADDEERGGKTESANESRGSGAVQLTNASAKRFDQLMRAHGIDMVSPNDG